MEARPKRQSTMEKDYRERKRSRRISSSEMTGGVSGGLKDEAELYSQLNRDYNIIMELRDANDDEYFLASMFMELPSKKEYPDYYDTIKQPIAMENIRSKIDQRKYQSLTQFKADLELMVSNAKKYNVKDSQVYDDATQIQKFIKTWSLPKPALKLGGDVHNKPIKNKPGRKPNNPSLKLLMNAVGKKDHKAAMEILQQQPDLNPNDLASVEMFGDKFTWSPLHAAAYYGDLKLVDALMARGGDIEIQDTWHSATPLGWAAFGDRDRMVRLLVQKYHADVNAENRHGQVPYDVVSDQDDPRWIGLFIQNDNTTTTTTNNNNNNNTPNMTSHQQIGFSPHNQQMQHIQHLQQQQQQQQQFLIQQRRLQLQQQPQQLPHHGGMNYPGNAFNNTGNDPNQPMKKRRGRPPKSETDAADVRPMQEIDLRTFDPVGFAIELFNAIRTHTDNGGRLYSELFEDLPHRNEYPDYYKLVKHPRSLAMVAAKMEKRAYPDLHQWMTDMKLVFENALSFNVPGSRIFRDAKLLLRLLHRLKERIFAKLAVPVSQEEAALRINLSNRPFDADALSEDKRKTRRIINRLRNESIEPPEPSSSSLHHVAPPGVNPYLLQQQQQHHMQQQQQQMQQQMLLQQQQLQQQQQQHLQQQLLQQQQSQQKAQQMAAQQHQQMLMQHQRQQQAAAIASAQQQQQQQMALAQSIGMSMAPINAMSLPMSAPMNAMSLSMSLTPPMNNNTSMSMNIPPGFPTTSSPAMRFDMPTNNHFGDQLIDSPPFDRLSSEFYTMIKEKGLFFECMQISSNDASFQMEIAGDYLGHSITVPSHLHTINISPKLPKTLTDYRGRIHISLVQNNQIKLKHHEDMWTSVALSRGTHIRVTMTANVSMPEARVPEYKTRAYHLFINQS